MQRFFLEFIVKKNEPVIITDHNILHHARDVLKLKINEEVVIVDKKGNEYTCFIEEISEKLVLKVKLERLSDKDLKEKMKITVACAIPKKAKMDEIIDKLTQLGVDRIIPLETQHVIVKLESKKRISRQARWEKIALSASQQSQRNSIPQVSPICQFKEVLSDAQNYDLKLIPTLIGKRESLRAIFNKEKPNNILILIGPEGDFTEEEVRQAKAKGFIAISLGASVLRVDTAAIAVVSFLRLYENS